MSQRVSLALAAIVLFGASAVFSQTHSPEMVVRNAGVKGGLVVHVGCRDGTFTAGLRLNDSYVVQGLDTDAADVGKARQYIRSLGIYGPVTAAAFDGEHLPYAENLINLLIVEDGADLPADEIKRVMAPRGVVLVNKAGRWRKRTKPWPDDIDEWTHFLHGPDNNAVAKDTRVLPPQHTQWVSGPRWGRSHDHMSGMSAAVSSAGRLFYIIDEGPIASVKAPSEWMLAARDAFSGVLLWKKEISPWEDQLRPFRSGPAELPRRLVAVGERVYTTLGYGKPVTVLDAATGEVVRTYSGTDNTHEIAVHDGNIYLVISAPLTGKSPTTGKVLRDFPVWRGSYLEYVTQYMPKHIRVINAGTGDLIWKKDDAEAKGILPLTLTIGDGRVFFQNEDQLVALAANSGDVLWRAERPAARHRYAWLTPTVVLKDGIVLSADRSPELPVDTGSKDMTQVEWRVSANHILEPGDIRAFCVETGEELWTAPSHEGFNAPTDVFVIDGKVWTSVLAWGKQPGITDVYDLQTGKVVATRTPDQEKYTLGFGHSRCYRHKATSNYIVQGRAGVEFVDLNVDDIVADHWVRGACQYGVLPCNGLVYAPTHPCACYITAKLNGFNALAGGERPMLKTGPQTPNVLEKGPAYAQLKTQNLNLKADNDWPTYRADNARSGGTDSAVSPRLRPRWEKALPGPLTAVVCADDRLFVAQREAHAVHAVRSDNGSPIWSYTVAGRIDSPPTVYADFVYFGSADGWIYCLRAADGKLAWRFQVAPESRQVVSYGQLESAWPVPGTVLVCEHEDRANPVAYAAAGRSSYVDGGVYLCAVDAVTGELITRRRISHLDPKTGLERQDTIRGVKMPGAIPDVLACDGSSIFMRHQRFDLDGKTLEQNVDHLFCSAGYVDDTWWHRTYLQIGREMSGGYGGWGAAGRQRISGKALVRNDNRAFGFGRKDYTITGSHLGLQSESHLFGAETELITPEQKKNSRRPPATQVKYIWSRVIPFYPRAMLLAGETLFLAGPDNVLDFDEKDPAGKVSFWAVSAEDGTTMAEYTLQASPVYDSFAAADGRLFFTTVDGRVVCYQPAI